jgi:hypothetical protein
MGFPSESTSRGGSSSVFLTLIPSACPASPGILKPMPARPMVLIKLTRFIDGTIVNLEKCLFNESKFKTKEVKYNVYLLINPND